MAAELASIASVADLAVRAERYSSFLSRAAELADESLFHAYVSHIVDSTLVPQALSRELVESLAGVLPRLNPQLHKSVATFFLRSINDRVHSYEDEATTVHRNLAKVYENEHDWNRAARALAGIPFDGTSRTVVDTFRLECYVKIARYFIEGDNAVDADHYVSRAGLLMKHCVDEGVRLMYMVCVARILDAKRKFEDAAMKYYTLSQLEPGVYGDSSIGDADASQALNFAITCAILAPAGPRRSRVLAILHSDERSRSLSVFPILESIHMGRLLSKEQVDEFRPALKPHQLAIDVDGVTVLDKAVMEHNILAASKLYVNMRFDELGHVLNVSPEKAESTAAAMIYEGRMNAVLDQVEGIVEFHAAGTKQEILRWDSQIDAICSVVDSCCDAILAKYPQLAMMP